MDGGGGSLGCERGFKSPFPSKSLPFLNEPPSTCISDFTGASSSKDSAFFKSDGKAIAGGRQYLVCTLSAQHLHLKVLIKKLDRSTTT